MFTMQQFGDKYNANVQRSSSLAIKMSRLGSNWGTYLCLRAQKAAKSFFVKAVFTAFMMHNHSWLQVLERVQTIFLVFCFRNCETVYCKIFWVMTS